MESDFIAERVTYIVGKAKHNLRGTIPSCGDIFGHEPRVTSDSGGSSARGITSGQAKVTDLEFTVSINQKIARLQIPVQDVRGVDIFESAQGLINEGLKMSVSQGLPRTDLRNESINIDTDSRASLQSHVDQPP